MDFRIKKLDLFISRQFGLLFVGTFFISQFVLMMQFLWQYVDDVIGKGLSMEVLAQFFWYMGLMLVPQALPLAILLSSLIAFGNLGESSELTAIKAAGISLMQSFRSLIFISILITFASFYFQNNVGPTANMKLGQLMLSMKQKSPELEIPEGIFYDGIPNSNIYVQKKDMKTGKLYGVMIYRMTNSYEDQAIILADSGMLQSTAEKKHLVLSLWSGEWFENMQEQEFGSSAAVPYRRESFVAKKIILDFDGDFNLTDAAALSNNSRGKSLSQLSSDLDSLNHQYDSIGRAFYKDAKRSFYAQLPIPKKDSLLAAKKAQSSNVIYDSIYAKLSNEKKQSALNFALGKVQQQVSDLEMKSMITKDGDNIIRRHEIEIISKFSLALTCLIFFFIGAPLGAIIRKGGLGVPVIIAVFVFIIYYILDNTGYRMARQGSWAIWFGKGLAPAILIPTAVFFTYKATNDSMVFNIDLYKDLFMRMFEIRRKRNISSKEVIIYEPDYANDSEQLTSLNKAITAYSQEHKLKTAPNVINVFIRYTPDHEIERISNQLETVIEDLQNTRDKMVLSELNHYPILAVKAHTRPFERQWLNILSGIILPLGIFFYIRMWGFRIRLLKDLKTIRQTNINIIKRSQEILQ